MKNHITLFLICFLIVGGLNEAKAQKAKFKNLVATCQKIRLPENYVAPENRTYAIYTKGSYSSNIGNTNRGIYGWAYSEESPTLEAVVSVYGFSINPPSRSSENKERKDKDGNVKERWTEYTYSGSAEGKGTLYVYGQAEAFVYDDPEREPTKAELRKMEREQEAAEKLASNPFLTDEVEEDTGESDIGEDSGLDGAKLPLAYTRSLDVNTAVRTAAHRSIKAAYDEYKKRQIPQLNTFRANYPSQSYNLAINSLNAAYGYTPTNYNMWLKEMKTEDHPEFEMWNNACQATQALFKKFRYNQSIEGFQAQFDPIIKYFHDQLDAIPEGDKKNKRMRKAAFSNLINIMFYLDRYDEVSSFCLKYEDSKDLDRTAQKMRERAKKQSALLSFHHVDSRHFNQMPDIEGEEFESESEDEGDEDEDDSK
jgi:hypothetical protein